MQPHERIGGHLEVEVRPLGGDEVAERVIEIESHDEAYIGPVMAALESGLGSYATSRSFWASARDCSFFSDWFSIWRIRSRVTLNVRPTSSSVRGCSPPRP